MGFWDSLDYVEVALRLGILQRSLKERRQVQRHVAPVLLGGKLREPAHVRRADDLLAQAVLVGERTGRERAEGLAVALPELPN